VLLALGLALSVLGRNALFYPPLAVNFVIWTLMGFLLTALSLAKGIRESSGKAETRPRILKDEDPVQ